jgi:hypothetical protein
MRKAIIPAFLLVLGSIVLGTTVLREPLANAASPFTNVIIGNDTSNPVPVRDQNVDANGDIRVHDSGGGTALVATAQVDGTHVFDLDVSQYREIRFAVNEVGCPGGDASFNVVAIEGGSAYGVLSIPVCNANGIISTFNDELNARVIELPGRTIQIQSNGLVKFAVFGRTN